VLRRVRAVVSSESLHSVQHMRRRLVRDDSVATRHLARSHRAFPFCSTKSSRAPPIRGSVRPMGMERCKHGGPAGDNSRRCPELPPVQRPAIPEPEAPTAVMSAACGPRRPDERIQRLDYELAHAVDHTLERSGPELHWQRNSLEPLLRLGRRTCEHDKISDPYSMESVPNSVDIAYNTI